MPFGGYSYEADRGAIPAYDNQWNPAGLEGWLTYHPTDNSDRVTQPLAIVHSEAAAIPQGVRTFLEDFAGEATLQMLEEVTQFDFYDNPEDVTRAADAMATHFAVPTGSESWSQRQENCWRAFRIPAICLCSDPFFSAKVRMRKGLSRPV